MVYACLLKISSWNQFFDCRVMHRFAVRMNPCAECPQTVAPRVGLGKIHSSRQVPGIFLMVYFLNELRKEALISLN